MECYVVVRFKQSRPGRRCVRLFVDLDSERILDTTNLVTLAHQYSSEKSIQRKIATKFDEVKDKKIESYGFISEFYVVNRDDALALEKEII